MQTIYNFHFEVKLYKYVVLGWKECLGVFYKRNVVVVLSVVVELSVVVVPEVVVEDELSV